MKDNEVEIVLNEEDAFEQRALTHTLNHKKNPLNVEFQLQRGPQIEDRSAYIHRSQALQSVMNQNEDLMARLKAAMIRNSEFENQLEEKDLEVGRLRKERDDLHEQTLILKEKELIFRERTERSLQKGEQYKEENTELLLRLSKVERAFRRLFKYREKIRTQVPYLKTLRKKAHRLTDVNSHLKRQIDELTTRLQKIHSEMSESQANLVSNYEAQIQKIQQDLEAAQKKANERDQFKQSQVEFENRSIELDRELQHVKFAYSKESQALRSDLEQYRRQTKELLVQCETIKSQMSSKVVELKAANESNEKLSDQVESLQILWREKQEDLERSQEKNRSLQKLNQDISLKVNELKKECHQLKQKLEAETEMLNRVRKQNQFTK